MIIKYILLFPAWSFRKFLILGHPLKRSTMKEWVHGDGEYVGSFEAYAFGFAIYITIAFMISTLILCKLNIRKTYETSSERKTIMGSIR